MRVQLLYFDGCPSYELAAERLRRVLAELGMDNDPAMIRVDTEQEARALRFAGSPTIRIDGEDLFPTQRTDVIGLGCRLYRTPAGPAGAPTIEMIAAALGRAMSRNACRE